MFEDIVLLALFLIPALYILGDCVDDYIQERKGRK